MQAIGGQLEVLRSRQPLSEVIDDAATDDKLRARLQMVEEARRFAVDDLLLPQNDSYSSYADLQRDYVVWNVFAAPEFSLQPRQWCYPIAGCVIYRGYFAEEKANRYAEKLDAKGFDVIVGGVAAYSTLGRFDDPILNTMLRWSDTGLVETLFHELAHQKLYVKDDSAFNESFATAVAEVGIERWLRARGMPLEVDRLERSRQLQVDVRRVALDTVESLNVLYDSDLPDAQMRLQKRQLLDALSATTQATIDASGLQVGNWLAAPLNNAQLVSVGAYEGHLGAFHVLMRDCDDGLECFYSAAGELAELDYDGRQRRLEELAATVGASAGPSSQAAADPVSR